MEDSNTCNSFSYHPGKHRHSEDIDYSYHIISQGVQWSKVETKYVDI